MGERGRVARGLRAARLRQLFYRAWTDAPALGRFSAPDEVASPGATGHVDLRSATGRRAWAARAASLGQYGPREWYRSSGWVGVTAGRSRARSSACSSISSCRRRSRRCCFGFARARGPRPARIHHARPAPSGALRLARARGQGGAMQALALACSRRPTTRSGGNSSLLARTRGPQRNDAARRCDPSGRLAATPASRSARIRQTLSWRAPARGIARWRAAGARRAAVADRSPAAHREHVARAVGGAARRRDRRLGHPALSAVSDPLSAGFPSSFETSVGSLSLGFAMLLGWSAGVPSAWRPRCSWRGWTPSRLSTAARTQRRAASCATC